MMDRYKNKWKWVLLISLFGILILMILFVFPVKRRFKAAENQINERMGKLSDFYRLWAGEPSQQKLTKSSREVQEIKMRYFEIREELGLDRKQKVRKIPPIEFRDRLYQTRKRLAAVADEYGAEIDSDLGFESAIPAEEDIPELLGRLEIIEKIVSMALNSGINEISRIELVPDGFVDEEEKELEVSKIAFLLEIVCDNESQVRFLDMLARSKELFIVEDLKIERINKTDSFSEKKEEEKKEESGNDMLSKYMEGLLGGEPSEEKLFGEGIDPQIEVKIKVIAWQNLPVLHK